MFGKCVASEYILLFVCVHFMIFTHHCTDYYWLLLTPTDPFWLLLTTSDHYCQPLSSTVYFWLVLTTTTINHYWLPLNTTDYYWLLLTTNTIVVFQSFLIWLGCGSSLTSQHLACPISLYLGDQSNWAMWGYYCSKTKIRVTLTDRSTGLHLWDGAHQTFLNTQITWESLVRVIGRGEVGMTGYQPNSYAY